MYVSRLQKLETIDVSSWNTAAVTNMFCMFYECGNLTSLDLSGWNTGSVTDMSHMFFNCGKLASVYVGIGWNTDNASISGNMFLQCKNLREGKVLLTTTGILTNLTPVSTEGRRIRVILRI